jgi:hypothetical protein
VLIQVLDSIHVPLFFAALRSPTEREFIQPSLIFAALALSMFLKSSDLELGAKGRTTACKWAALFLSVFFCVLISLCSVVEGSGSGYA